MDAESEKLLVNHGQSDGAVDESTSLLPITSEKSKQRRKCWNCLVYVVLLLMVVFLCIITVTFFGTLIAMVFINNVPTPSISSSVTAYRAQSVPLVLVLATYDKSEYSSFMVTSDIPIDTDVSATVWAVETIEPITNTYFKEYVSIQAARNILLNYALADSSFQIIFGPLDGPMTANATIEFRKYNGGGRPGEILVSQSFVSSKKKQSIKYISVEPGFIEFRLINNGLNGSVMYNFTINQLTTSSLKKSDYNCTLNSINRACKHSSVYSTNNLLASVTLDHDYIQGYPTFNITLKEDILRIPIMPLGFGFMACMLCTFLPVVVLGILLIIFHPKKKNASAKNF